MSDPQEREWRFYVEDMVGFCSKVLSYTHDLDASSFAGSGIHYDATLRNIELVVKQRPTYPRRFDTHTRKSPGEKSSPRATG